MPYCKVDRSFCVALPDKVFVKESHSLTRRVSDLGDQLGGVALHGIGEGTWLGDWPCVAGFMANSGHAMILHKDLALAYPGCRLCSVAVWQGGFPHLCHRCWL